MHKIAHRLKSQSGSSLLIAIAFFLICFFVGSAVLAAGTANAGRLNQMWENRQNFLYQRSAALLLKKEMTSDDIRNSSMEIYTTTTRTVTITNRDGATTVTPVTLKAPEVTVSTTASELQRIMCQVATWTYFERLKAEGDQSEFQYKDPTFYGTDTVVPKTTPTGTLTVNLSDGNTQVANYSCKYSSGGSTIVLRVDFEQICVMVRASVMESYEMPTIVTSSSEAEGVQSTTETRTEVSTQTITWSDPVIIKGGAAK